MDVVKIGDERRKHGPVEMPGACRHRELEGLARITHVRGELDFPLVWRHRVRREPSVRFR